MAILKWLELALNCCGKCYRRGAADRSLTRQHPSRPDRRCNSEHHQSGYLGCRAVYGSGPYV